MKRTGEMAASERVEVGRESLPDSVIRLRCPRGRFWYRWMQFLRPFHGLSAAEMEICGRLLELREEWSADIADGARLDAAVLGRDGRAELCRRCGVTPQRLQVSLGKFRRAGIVLEGDRIDGHYVPVLGGKGSYRLMVWMDIDG